MEEKYRIAVASRSGKLVDCHFGHAEEFIIYQGNKEDFLFLEKRPVEKYCQGEEDCGEERREKIFQTLSDCHLLLVMRIGYGPRKRLEEMGIKVLEWPDTLEQGLKYALKTLIKRGGNRDE